MIKQEFICEIGLNHLGDINYLKKYINKIYKYNIKKVTFQIREDSFYKKKENKDLILNKFEFTKELRNLKKKGVSVGLSLAEYNFEKYLQNFKPDFFKILSWSANNINLINQLTKFNVPIFISLGTLSHQEIKNLSNKIKNKNNINYIYTHLDYSINKANLNYITTLKENFNIPVSYGHHFETRNLDEALIPLIAASVLNVKYLFIYIKIDEDKIHKDEIHAFYFHDYPFIKDKIQRVRTLIGRQNKLGIKEKKINTSKQGNINLRNINFIIFDFDGVFTDNKVYVDSNGVETVRCDRGDGMAINLLRQYMVKNQLEIKLMILSTEKDKATLQRAQKLKIPCIRGIENKYEYLFQKFGQKIFSKVIYLGNDINDLNVMKYSKYSVSPGDAHEDVRKISNIRLNALGGKGFVREFVDLVIN